MPKYVIVDESGGYVLAREVEENGRIRFVPTLKTVSNSLITAELAASQLNDGLKYRALKEAVRSLLHDDPCEDSANCDNEGVCGQCLGRLEDAYDALEPKT